MEFLTNLIDADIFKTVLTAILSWSLVYLSAILDAVKPGLQDRKRDKIALFLIRKILNNFNPTTLGQATARRLDPSSVNAMRVDDNMKVNAAIETQAKTLATNVTKRKFKFRN